MFAPSFLRTLLESQELLMPHRKLWLISEVGLSASMLTPTFILILLPLSLCACNSIPNVGPHNDRSPLAGADQYTICAHSSLAAPPPSNGTATPWPICITNIHASPMIFEDVLTHWPRNLSFTCFGHRRLLYLFAGPSLVAG